MELWTTYLNTQYLLTQMRGYIYATAAPGVGGGFEADSRPCLACHAPCTLQHDATPACCCWPCHAYATAAHAAVLRINVAASVSREEMRIVWACRVATAYHQADCDTSIRRPSVPQPTAICSLRGIAYLWAYWRISGYWWRYGQKWIARMAPDRRLACHPTPNTPK